MTGKILFLSTECINFGLEKRRRVRDMDECLQETHRYYKYNQLCLMWYQKFT